MVFIMAIGTPAILYALFEIARAITRVENELRKLRTDDSERHRPF